MNIYVVHCQHLDCIKIGIARNTRSRLIQIQTGCPYEVILVEKFNVCDQRTALAIEKSVATKLRQFHMLGEWYNTTPSVAIQEVRDAINRAGDLLHESDQSRKKWNNVHSYGQTKTHRFQGKTPAQVVIERFGGVRNVARAIGCNPSSVTRWRRDSGAIGTGGRIPSSAQQLILERANELGIPLTVEEVMYGSTR